MTLVEILVALGIFAAVSAIAVGALGLAANGTAQLDEAASRIGRVETFRIVMRDDLNHLVARQAREPNIVGSRPAFVGGDAAAALMDRDDETTLLMLTRSGWTNAGSREPRAEVQAVSYLLKDDQLVRRTRPFIDAALDTPFRDQVLLEDLRNLDIAFLTARDWREETEPGARPVALRISFEHPDYGLMEHIFLTGGSS
jgi:type II secretion system protein J